MKKTKPNHQISVVCRENTALASDLDDNTSSEPIIKTAPANERNIQKHQANNDQPKSEPAGKPLIELLAVTSEFFLFSYSPALRSLITWSDNAKLVLGVDDGRIARDGNLFLRHVHVDDRFQLLNDLEAALEGKVPFRATYRWIRPDRNELRWLHCRANLNHSASREIFEGIILDITDELAGPLKYFSGSDSAHGILSALPGIVIILDEELRIIRLSYPPEIEKFSFGDFAFKQQQFRVGQRLVKCFSDKQIANQVQTITESIFAKASRSEYFRVFENGRSYKVDFFSQNSFQGNTASLSDTISRIVCVVSDITDLVRLEARVADLQRAESLRLLSAGIGHHFNNALQTIIGQATVINTHSEEIDLVKRASDSIVTSSIKAAELTKQLFANTEKNPLSQQLIDPNLALTEAVNHVNDLFKSGFKLSLVLGQISLVSCNYSALKSAFEAILRCAKDAISEKFSNIHHLSIKTCSVELSNNQVHQLVAGKYSLISISDSGTPLDLKALSQALNSMLKTTDTSAPSQLSIYSAGLGISQAFSIICSYKGTIKIENRKSEGDCIDIYLPVDPSQLTTELDPCISDFDLKKSTEDPKILLVDDDRLVCSAIQSMLRGLKQDCIVADNYSSALTLMKRFEKSIQLVLLDAVLPMTDSTLILKKLKLIKPSVNIIGFSGASEEQTHKLLKAGALEIVQKPIQLSRLKEIIDHYLNKKSKHLQS